MKVLVSIVMATMFLSSFARADVMDRINDCEKQGGGACVFSLLRELAAGNRHGGGRDEPILTPGNYAADRGAGQTPADPNGIIEVLAGPASVSLKGKSETYSSDGAYSCKNFKCEHAKDGSKTYIVIGSPKSFTLVFTIWTGDMQSTNYKLVEK